MKSDVSTIAINNANAFTPNPPPGTGFSPVKYTKSITANTDEIHKLKKNTANKAINIAKMLGLPDDIPIFNTFYLNMFIQKYIVIYLHNI